MSGDLFWLLLVGLTDCCFSAEPPQPPAASTRLSPHSRPAAARPGRWCRPAQPSPAQPSPAQSFLSLCLAQRSRSLPQPDPATAAPAPLCSLTTAAASVPRSGWSPAPAPRTPSCACSPPWTRARCGRSLLLLPLPWWPYCPRRPRPGRHPHPRPGLPAHHSIVIVTCDSQLKAVPSVTSLTYYLLLQIVAGPGDSWHHIS